jgi:hypothetical protein
VRLLYFVLHKIGQNLSYQFRERRPVVAPTPNCHIGNPEKTRSHGIAAEDHFKQEIVAARGHTAFEAR